MISKLPRWVWMGALVLAFIAGMINAVGFVGFQHQGITHLTGTTTLLGVSIASADTQGAFHLVMIILSFMAGATASGMIVKDNTLSLNSRYAVALMFESAMLFASVPLFQQHNVLGDYLASAACGLQNAMVSTYSGATLRTTHVSGIFTDLGIFFGHLLRGLPSDWRRFRLWMTLLGGFFGGGIAGALIFHRIGYATLYYPATLTGITGLAYGVYRQYRRKENGATE